MRLLATVPCALTLLVGLACGAPHEQAPATDDTMTETPLSDAFEPTTPRVEPGVARGKIGVEPEHFTAARIGDFHVRVTVGEGGIATGGGILIDIPKTWLSELYVVAKRLQREQSDAPHFVSVAASDADAQLAFTLEYENLDGKHSRYPRIVAVRVVAGRLDPGDEVTLTLHRTTAPFIAGRGAVRAAVDPTGTGSYRLLARPAWYRVEAAPATRFNLFGPSQAVVGEVVELQLTALDGFANPAAARGVVTLAGVARSPLVASSGSLERGVLRFRWRPQEAGFRWPVAVVRLATADGETERRVAGDPIRVFAAAPPESIYWGDLQSHSAVSKDGIGHHPLAYARDVMRLDFVASTEHSEDDRDPRVEKDGITPAEWRMIQQRVWRFYEPGRFVTLLGYEYTLSDEHHCVYFRRNEGVPWNPRRVGSIENLWDKLDARSAFTIPHHLGRSTGWHPRPPVADSADLMPPPPPRSGRYSGPTVDWRRPAPTPPSLRPALEIYSSHGTSESADRRDPLAYHRVLYLPSRPHPGNHYARHAWAYGHRVGTVAGSDNHTGQPGQPHNGLTAVRAPTLERGAIFDAIRARRTYATTGRRVYMEFEVAGTEMGDAGVAPRDLSGRLLVAAAHPLEFVQVMRFQDPEIGWQVEREWRNVGRLLEDRFLDRIDSPDVIYYLRVGVAEPEGGRAVRAWSSPIWLEIRS